MTEQLFTGTLNKTKQNKTKTVIGLASDAVIQKVYLEELHLPELNNISKIILAYLAPPDNVSCVPNC